MNGVSPLPLLAALGLYALAVPAYALARGAKLAPWLFAAAGAAQGWVLLGLLQSGPVALATLSGRLVIFGFALAALALLSARRHPLGGLGALAALLQLAVLAGTLAAAGPGQPVDATALQDGCSAAQSLCAWTGLASLTLALLLSLPALPGPGSRASRLFRLAAPADPAGPVLPWLRFGFLLLSAALLASAAGAQRAWGDFWAWPPAEFAVLVAWFAYAAVLHVHHLKALKGRPLLRAASAAWVLTTLAGALLIR